MSNQHSHEHHDNPIDQAVNQAVTKAVTHPALIQSIMSGIHEQNAMASLSNCERMRPVQFAEALVEPKPYNARGDTMIFIRRRLFFAGVTNVIVSFTKDAADNVEFSAVLYVDHFQDTLQTKFIELSDPALIEEFNRQIAEFYKPEMEDKSVQLVMILTKGNKEPNKPADDLQFQDQPVAEGQQQADILPVGRF